MTGGDHAGLPDERADGEREVFDLPDGVRDAPWLNKVPPFSQPPPALDRPVEDAGQFDQQLVREVRVFLPVEALRQLQDDEPARERTARVA